MTVTTNWPARIAYTFDEAVFASGVPRRTLQYAIKEGRLKSYFSAGRRRVFPADLEEFLRGVGQPLARSRLLPRASALPSRLGSPLSKRGRPTSRRCGQGTGRAAAIGGLAVAKPQR